jgi:acetyl esterase/lipase
MSASWLYLAVSLWGAGFTLNAHRPRWTGPRVSALSFASGWLTTELALHHIAWQAAATLVFAGFGAFAAWPGWLGLGITVISWAGLIACQRQAAAAGAVCEEALQRAFGDDYLQEVEPGLRESLSNELDWRQVVRPFPIRRKSVERIKDICYSRAKGIDLHLDIYRNRAQPNDCPVLLQIHGGGWIIGSKDEQALPLMNQLAEMGWVCVTADYRLSPHATFPEHLIDLKRALVWVKQHIAEYGGNPEFIAVTGGSAGGHLCALMGLTQNDPEYQPGFEDEDSRVDVCVPYYGVYDFVNRSGTHLHDGLGDILERQIMKGSKQEIPEAWDRASPIARIGADTPPFLIIHGGNDTLVPALEAQAFDRALAEQSPSAHCYIELAGAQHAFDLFPSLRTLRVNMATCRFLALMYSRALAARRRPDADREPVEPVENGAAEPASAVS